ncbi:biotin transporter BioY [Candidatus Enterococcus leclercqii]|uniref:biotin transporter BioY n=1 Tax=Enterococcus TaxID=1350 RepID=UPI00137AD7E4|nr:biotin transporter BioY [Enterococcus sp. CU9D]KAF1293438.1 BioY family transporter [Enterococcus sp. CU9D]
MRISLREQILAAVFAAIIGILSQFVITLPITVVPFTLQTFIIGLTVTILGMRTGTWAIVIYLLLGLIGIPVYAGGASGIGALLGPTGGFLIGFIFNGLVTGGILAKTKLNFLWSIIANLAGAAVVLLFGAAWMHFGTGMTFSAALNAAVIPFILPGILKAVAAAVIGVLIVGRLPQRFLTPAK